MDNNISKNNNSIILKSKDKDEFDISNDYLIIKNKKNIKQNKDNKKIIKKVDLSGHKNIYKNHYNTINNESCNYKVKINHRNNNSTGRRNNSKKYNNKKHEKGLNSDNLIV